MATKHQELRVTLRDGAYAYICGGANADRGWRDMNSALELNINNAEPLLLRNAGADAANTRHILMSFDISAIKASGLPNVFLAPSWSRVHFAKHYLSIYDLGAAVWDGNTVTGSNAPSPVGDAVVSRELCRNLATYNITPVVQRALSEGRDSISIMLKAEDVVHTYDHLEPTTTVLIATSREGVAIADGVRALLPDAEADAALWGYVEKTFDEWHARYLVLKDVPMATAQKIVSDEDEFSKIIMAGSYMGFTPLTEDKLKKACPTRTYADLDDLGDYSDYDKEYPFDTYGGLMNPDMKQEATGFFYSKKLGDRWWFIDPLGYPCHIRALHQPTLSYRGFSVRQREEAIKRYGSEEGWRHSVCRWLKNDLYFNAINSHNVFYDVEQPMVWQAGVSSFLYGYGKQQGVDDYRGGSTTFAENNTMPVFDPGFEQYCMRAAEKAVELKDDPWFLGYTTDNELPLGQEMLLNYLTLNPDKQINGVYVNQYSYAAAWTFFRKMTGKEQPLSTDVTDELLELFRSFVYDRYFCVTKAAIKTYDPNHMYLGPRIVTNSTKSIADAVWVARFASLYLDGMAINWYGQWTIDADALCRLCSAVDLPMMVTEFYAKGMENDGGFTHPDTPLANSRGAGWAVKTQQDRADFYQNYTLRLLECKNMVGWYWFMYIDNDDSPEAIYKTGALDPSRPVREQWRDQSSVDVNKGIVNNWHEPYEEICGAMTRLHKNVYRLIEHFDAKYAKKK